MMIKKSERYQGFTLVEMLIVMGILIILMAIGTAVGRFAIQRANNIQHNSAADQLSQAIASHYVDKRKYPTVAQMNNGSMGLTGTNAPLDTYVDADFDGGSDTTFYYFTDSNQQSYLVCVAYGEGQGGYCAGNGFGTLPSTGSAAATDKTMPDTSSFAVITSPTSGATASWVDSEWRVGTQTTTTP